MEQKASLLDRLKEELTFNLEKIGLSRDNEVELRKDTSKTGLIQFQFSRSWYRGTQSFYRFMFDTVKSFYAKEGFSVDKNEIKNDEDRLEYLSATNMKNENETYIITVGSGLYKGSFGVAIQKFKSRYGVKQLSFLGD